MEGEVKTTETTNTNESQLETQIVSINDLLGGDINSNPIVTNVPKVEATTVEQTATTETTTVTTDPPKEEVTTTATTTTETNTETSQITTATEEYDDEKILKYFESKGKKVSVIDELFKEPEVKTVNKYENISDKAKAFLTYHEETGRDFEDYLELQKDITAIPDIDLARERVRQENGRSWTNDEIDSFLEKQLKIDLSDLEGMDAADKIALSGFSKPLRDSKLSEQEKYKQPLENKNTPAAQEKNQIADDEVELASGERMKKVDYDRLLKSRQDYLDGLKASSDNIKEASFSVKVDNKGSEQTLNFNYEYSTEDKHNMLSNAEDLQNTIKQKFSDDKGFNHKELQEAMFWIDPNNRVKAISAIIHKAIAGNTEEIMKEVGNVNLIPDASKTLTTQPKEGTRIASVKELLM